MGRKKTPQKIEVTHKQKKLTDIFAQPKKREEKEDIHDEKLTLPKLSEESSEVEAFDFSDSKGHTQDEIEQIEEVIDEIKKREAQQDDNNDNGER